MHPEEGSTESCNQYKLKKVDVGEVFEQGGDDKGEDDSYELPRNAEVSKKTSTDFFGDDGAEKRKPAGAKGGESERDNDDSGGRDGCAP